MKTMSEFIQEQEILVTEDNDVEIMEGFMKLSAIAAVAECYCEHAAIAGFADSEGLNVFSESVSEVAKKKWDSIKAFFLNIWEWIKAMVKGVINIFTKSALEKCIAELKAAKTAGKKEIPGLDGRYLDAAEVLDKIEEFGEIIKKGSEKGGFGASKKPAEIEKFEESAEAFLKGYKENKKNDDFRDADESGVIKSQIDKVLAVLERLQKANIPSSGHKLLKKFDFDKKNYTNAEGEMDKELVKEIKKCANLLAKVYDKYTDSTVKMVRTLLKKEIKKDELAKKQQLNADMDAADKSGKPEKKGESFVDSTDGFSFLN